METVLCQDHGARPSGGGGNGAAGPPLGLSSSLRSSEGGTWAYFRQMWARVGRAWNFRDDAVSASVGACAATWRPAAGSRKVATPRRQGRGPERTWPGFQARRSGGRLCFTVVPRPSKRRGRACAEAGRERTTPGAGAAAQHQAAAREARTTPPTATTSCSARQIAVIDHDDEDHLGDGDGQARLGDFFAAVPVAQRPVGTSSTAACRTGCAATPHRTNCSILDADRRGHLQHRRAQTIATTAPRVTTCRRRLACE